MFGSVMMKGAFFSFYLLPGKLSLDAAWATSSSQAKDVQNVTSERDRRMEGGRTWDAGKRSWSLKERWGKRTTDGRMKVERGYVSEIDTTQTKWSGNLTVSRTASPPPPSACLALWGKTWKVLTLILITHPLPLPVTDSPTGDTSKSPGDVRVHKTKN